MSDVKTQVGIEIIEDGPYHVTGGIPLVRVRKVPGERKESFKSWTQYETIPTEDEYWLCRCGRSETKPFCSGTHSKIGFDGTETAPTGAYAERAETLGGTKVTVKDDRSICAHAAFCSNAATNIWKAAPKTDDDAELAETVIEMVRNCPSGALTYEVDGTHVEEDSSLEIRVEEDGSYALRGRIPVRRSDGAPLETRNRMALCRCGSSENKPLCDGTHKKIGFTDG